MEHVGAVIRRLRKSRGLTLSELASQANFDAGNLSRVERGLQGIAGESLRALAGALGTTMAEIYREAERPQSPEEAAGQLGTLLGQARQEIEPQVELPILDLIPLIGSERGARDPLLVAPLRVGAAWLKRHVEAGRLSDLAVLPAFGDAMSPTFSEGDLLLLDRGVEALRGDAIYLLSVNGNTVLRRVQQQLDGSLLIKSDNPHYDPYPLAAADLPKLRVLGRVVWAWKGVRL